MFFLYLFLVLIIICILMIFSKIEIQIKNVCIDIPKKERYLNRKYQIIINLYILKKIKIFQLNITKTLLERNQIKLQIKNLENKIIKDKNNFDMEMFKVVKKLNIKIDKLYLKIALSTSDSAITAILSGLVTAILGILFKNRKQSDNQKFDVIPIYQDKFSLNLNFEGIFQINMIHIIYIIIYVLKQKRRVSENGRTSNRGTYAYSHE